MAHGAPGKRFACLLAPLHRGPQLRGGASDAPGPLPPADRRRLWRTARRCAVAADRHGIRAHRALPGARAWVVGDRRAGHASVLGPAQLGSEAVVPWAAWRARSSPSPTSPEPPRPTNTRAASRPGPAAFGTHGRPSTPKSVPGSKRCFRPKSATGYGWPDSRVRPTGGSEIGYRPSGSPEAPFTPTAGRA